MTASQIKKRFRWWYVPVAIFGLIVVCVVLLNLASATTNGPRSDPTGKTVLLRNALEAAFMAYEIDHGTFPPSMENYQVARVLSDNRSQKVYFAANADQLNASREYIDAWGTPLRFSLFSKDDVLILSAGPDKVFGTADDISNQ